MNPLLSSITTFRYNSPLQPYFLFTCERVLPVCCSRFSWSTTSQCSRIFSFTILYRSADLIFYFLFVGGIPWNSPLCVPVKLRKTTTMSFSVTMCSIFAWISGNALKSALKDCLNPSLRIRGFSLAKYLSVADMSC